MNYTRKRAVLACDFCRHRKRRCDGSTPCSNCRDAQADCVYKELATDRIESSSSSQEAVVERLSRIEALLEEQRHRLNELLTHRFVPMRSSNASSRQDPQIIAGSPASWLDDLDANLETQFLVPSGHSATLHYLLSLPPTRSLVGELPQSYFHDREEEAGLPEPLSLSQNGPLEWPSLEPDRLRGLADAYFDSHSFYFPLVTRQFYDDLQDRVLQHGPKEDLETAICLSVYALGCVASHTANLNDRHEDLGLEYFAASLKIITTKMVISLTPSLLLCQTLVLAAFYFDCLGRPLHAWKMIHYAGQQFLQVVNLRLKSGHADDLDEDHVRVLWCCFVKECDAAADFDVERNGIEPLGDKMRLPQSTDIGEAEDFIYFAAEMAIRRLVNRIIGSLYSRDNIDVSVLAETGLMTGNTNLHQLSALSSELNRQLDQYYATIPIQPPIAMDSTSTEKRRRLNLRSLYARHLIYRPFVLYVALQPSQPQPSPSIHQPSSSQAPTPQPLTSSAGSLPQNVLENCYICIQSCEAYILNVGNMLDRRTPCLWTFSQACLASLIMLYLASESLHLRHMTPDLDALASTIRPKLQKWAAPGSLFEELLRIMDLILGSRRFQYWEKGEKERRMVRAV